MVLLTGATGYIGGRLLRALERKAVAVRCSRRATEMLLGRVATSTEVVHGNLLEPASLGPAFAGVETAFYPVHAMRSGREFERLEREAARNFAEGGPTRRLPCRGVRLISGEFRFTSRWRPAAEMQVTGRAWLDFRAEGNGRSTVPRQIAYFEPRGLGGLLYWYLLWPVHAVMFRGTRRRIAPVGCWASTGAQRVSARVSARVPTASIRI